MDAKEALDSAVRELEGLEIQEDDEEAQSKVERMKS